jgi:hypothetical protein
LPNFTVLPLDSRVSVQCSQLTGLKHAVVQWVGMDSVGEVVSLRSIMSTSLQSCAVREKLMPTSYLSKPTVEGDNWMITQQTASYLIKKMQEVVENPNKTSNDDTQQLYRQYVQEKEHRRPLQAVSSGIVGDAAVVEAFKWRAAALVRLIIHVMCLISLTSNRHINAIMNVS